tara:strand:+ start:715 stop:1074 length:360 start_codon:yes stop_codon:yes gene_type:complete
MALGTLNDFSLHSGDSLTLEVTVNDAAAAAVDITSATFIWVLSKKSTTSVAPRGAAILTKALASGVAINDGPTGRADITLDPADTASLDGTYYHELQMTNAGFVSTVLYGSVTIAKDIA